MFCISNSSDVGLVILSVLCNLSLKCIEYIMPCVIPDEWLSIRIRHDLHTAILTYETRNGLQPPYLSNILSNISDVF